MASMFVNGCPTEEFPLEMGALARDPLSPFLFLLAVEGFNVLMTTMLAARMYHGYHVGRETYVCLSHFQFVDDTSIIGEKSWANVRSMGAVLTIFEQVFGLKVNFHKSLLTRVNVSDSRLQEAVMALSCIVGAFPFVYLGMPIGGDACRLEFWKSVMDHIISRLSNKKSKFLSLEGHLILLKYVLSFLSVYFLSFFVAPTCIISYIESLFKKKWG